MGDRHVVPRNYRSGAEKRKIQDEKNKKVEEVLSKTPKISSFFVAAGASAACSIESDLSAIDDSASVSVLTEASNSATVEPEVNDNSNFENDMGMWSRLSEKEVDYWIENGPSVLHHCDEKKFESSVNQERGDITGFRKCTKSLFYRKLQSETVFRNWLCFSPHSGKLYCFVCKLMNVTVSSFSGEGFCNWRRAQEKIGLHETSKAHLESSVSISSRAGHLGVDKNLKQLDQQTASYWRDVLKRVVSAITFLSQRGLAFRGEDEVFGSSKNGNFLGILELIAEYDPFLAQHIEKHGNKKSGHVNYLSSTICNELIDIMAEMVFEKIAERIRKAKYYSISVDSTPDESHIDQLTVVVRYLEGTKPVERFLTFIPNCGHAGQQMVDALLKFLQDHNIDFQDCRGQAYDNAPNMSGKYKGMQALILQKNPYAFFVPCCAHSLNLIGKSAANTCSSAVEFFNFMQNLFTFFTNSTSRFKVLTDNLSKTERKYTVKNLSDTRWSCRADATKALYHGYAEIKATLSSIAENPEEKDLVKNEAVCLYNKMCLLENAIYIQFWNDILERFNATSQFLQNPATTLKPAVNSILSLIDYVEEKRAKYDDYEVAGKKMSGSESYRNIRSRMKNVRLSEPGQGKQAGSLSAQTPKEKFKADAFFPVIDQIKASLAERSEAYKQICNLFEFISDMNATPSTLEMGAKKLVETYPADLGPELANELIQLASFAKQSHNMENQPVETFLYDFILNNDMRSTFPNAEIALRIYLSIMVSNASGERTFSRLKLIKNRLRTTMNNERLVNLTLLSIENEILKEIDVDKIIDCFQHKKSRKKGFVV